MTTQTRTKLEWTITAEAPAFDLDLDCWTATGDDGLPVYSDDEDDCLARLAEHNNHLRCCAIKDPENFALWMETAR